MPFAREHARGVGIAVRPLRPSSVGLHGRTKLKKAKFGYIDPKV